MFASMLANNNSGKLIVEPFGGLGNRMRTILAGVTLNRVLNKNMEVIWDIGHDLNCAYELLFEKSDLFEITLKSNSKYKVLSSYNDDFLKRQAIKIVNKANGLDLTIEEQDLKKTFYKNDYNTLSLRAYKNIYIRTCQTFLYSEEWRVFKPIKAIQHRISEITDTYTTTTIGIHIRRGDNTVSVEKSPFNLFKEAIEQEISKNKEVRFYLSTDDIFTQNQLLTDFGDKITIQKNKDLSRTTLKGIQDALVDLYCLSKTSKIIGSYWSSFTETAAAINKTPLFTVNKDKA